MVHPKGNQSWIFIGRTDAEAETTVLWPPDVKNWYLKRPWCWERLNVGGEEDDRGWDGWIASPTQWTRIWVNSGSWWWTGRPGAAFHGFTKSQTWPSNWMELNFNIVVSQGKGRSKERERDEEMVSWWSSQNTFMKFAILCGCSLWHPKIIMVTAKITDHRWSCCCC